MKYSEVASAHRQPESPASSAGSRDSLQIRLYFKDYLTDIVRAIGYEHVPLTDARARLGKLRDRYGPQVIDDAVEELIDIRPTSSGQVACLKDSVRKIAFGILGNPPADAAVPRVENATAETESSDEPLADDIDGEMDLRDDEPDNEWDDEESDHCPIQMDHPLTNDNSSTATTASVASTETLSLVPHDSTDATAKPVRRSIKEVQTGFAAWVADIGQNAEPLSPQRLKEFSARTRTVPDYVLRFGESLALVIIRPSLSKTQRHDMQEWQRVFGTHHAVLRIWPVKNKLRWLWTSETVFEAAESTKSQTGEPSATTQATTDVPRGPAPHKSTDFSHVSHRLDLLAEEMDGLDELLQQADKIQRQLRTDLEALRDQLRRGNGESR